MSGFFETWFKGGGEWVDLSLESGNDLSELTPEDLAHFQKAIKDAVSWLESRKTEVYDELWKRDKASRS